MNEMTSILDLLPSEWTVTAVLKLLALVIGTTSVIWALMQKTTFEDEEGRKRLTGAGRVAIALAAGSFLVGGLSAGFDAVLSAAKAEKKREEDAEQRLANIQSTNERRIHDAEVRASQAELLAGKARLESGQARQESALAQQQIFFLRESDADRKRDLRLSRNLNASSQSNLRNAQVILRNVQRAANPLGQIYVELEIEAPLSSASPELLADLRSFVQACLTCDYGAGLIARRDLDERRYPTVSTLATGFAVRVSLINRSPGGQDPRYVAFDQEPLPGDLHFATRVDSVTVVLRDWQPVSIILRVQFDSSASNPTVWSKTERMVSTNDLVGAAAAIQIDDMSPDTQLQWLKRQPLGCTLSVESGGRRFAGTSTASFIARDGERRCTLTLNEAVLSPRYRPPASRR